MNERPTNLGAEVGKLSAKVNDVGRNRRNALNVYSVTDLTATTTARTLDGTTPLYQLVVKIAHDLPKSDGDALAGNPTTIINRLSKAIDENTGVTKIVSSINWGSGGAWFWDNTNNSFYKESAWIDPDYIYIRLRIKRVEGSVSVPAENYDFRAFLLSPENDQLDQPGAGGGGLTVNLYYDNYTFDIDGNQTDFDSGSSQTTQDGADKWTIDRPVLGTVAPG